MNNHSFPTHGRVVLVDDKYDEIREIQRFLAENGIPYIFYDYADMHEMDIVKIDGIRLLFLDIRLEAGNIEPKNINSVLATTVEKIVPKDNGPYGIILWTNEYERKDDVSAYLLENLDNDETTKPLFISAMDKKDFSKRKCEELADEILNLYNKSKMFSFITEVENRAMTIPPNVIKMICYGFLNNVSNNELEKLLLSFVACEKGDNCDSSYSATKTLLRQFVGLIKDRYMEIISDERFVEKISGYWDFDFSNERELDKIRDEKIIEQIASVNTALNVNTYASSVENVPGKVYMHRCSITLGVDEKTLYKSTFRADKNCQARIYRKNDGFGNSFLSIYKEVTHNSKAITLTFFPIEMDITPNCDYAQAKNDMIRTVYGYIAYVDKGEVVNVTKHISKIEKLFNGFVYVTPVFKIRGNVCLLILNTKLLYLEKHGYSKKLNYLFRLNEEITNEIRKKAADNISRLGINSL